MPGSELANLKKKLQKYSVQTLAAYLKCSFKATVSKGMNYDEMLWDSAFTSAAPFWKKAGDSISQEDRDLRQL